MSDTSQAPSPPLLTENEKALLRRCYRIKKITDNEIVFPLTAPSIAKAAWFTMIWFLFVSPIVLFRWTDHKPLMSWILFGVFPAFFLIWLADLRPRTLSLRRGARSMVVDLGDGCWTIQLPRGSSPADWDFPTASVPIRLTANAVERVEAWEILGKFLGSSLREESEKGFLPLLDECGADVVGYDEDSVSIANFGSARHWVIGVGLSLLIVVPGVAWFLVVFFPAHAPIIAVAAGTLGALGACCVVYDGRRASVATFRRGKREVLLRHRGTARTYDVHENAVHVVSDGDAGELVIVTGVITCSPICGTANLLAGFLRKFLATPREKAPTSGT